METAFEFNFPSIRGFQAGREYYVSMCPMKLIPKIFTFDEEELGPEVRAQRTLNKRRVPEMAQYILDNRKEYVFSALTASIDSEAIFKPANGDAASDLGTLHIPMTAKFIINDGQHRRAAIEKALQEEPEIGEETIAVVFFMDKGLERCQQMFADLNRYAIRPSRSLGVLYDYRDEMAKLAKLVALKVPAFKGLIEFEKSTLSARSSKLLTLSALYTATSALIENVEFDNQEERDSFAIEYWTEVSKTIPEWRFVKEKKITAGEVRLDYIHSHGIALHALGRTGNTLSGRYPDTWRQEIQKLSGVDWSRSNASQWEGRAMIGGRVNKSAQNVILTSNVLKNHLSIPLTQEEQHVEDAFVRGNNG